jgi:putative transposase
MAMKQSKFTDAQIAFVLRHVEGGGTAIRAVCRKAGISEATFYNRRKMHSALMPSEMRRLKQLEEENGKLRKLAANLSLDRAMLQDVLAKSSEACAAPSLGGRRPGRVEGLDSSSLRGDPDGRFHPQRP